jgi:hypothetical protein
MVLEGDPVELVNDAANPDTLETDWTHGPTNEMCARWDAEWAARRIRWVGETHNVAVCRKLGWYARFTDRGWQRCGPDDDGATEDLNRTNAWHARWDADAQEWVPR